MGLFSIRLGLPLLTKELIEQSARKRTYILRVVYAIALYGITLWIFQRQLGSWNATGLSVLGHGRHLFISLAWFEFAGIYLFLPAMTCGVLTTEKERDTLGLLLLTKLGPWTIVFEKLFSRLVPMASFVMLSLPLLAVSYSLGGIESADIAKLMWVLFATAIQVGSFSVLCSAWFRTTAASFLATYLLGTLAILTCGFFYESVFGPGFQIVAQFLLSTSAYNWLFGPDQSIKNAWALAFGPSILNGSELMESGFGRTILPQQTVLDCIVMTFPLFGTSILCLVLARFVLWKRAFVRPRNLLLRLFKNLDRFFYRVNNNRVTRGIVLIRESVTLPLYEPIRWRETSKRSLGTTRYLIRMLLLLEVPVLVMVLWPTNDHTIRSGYAPAYVTCWLLWIVATLVLSIQSTGLIGRERSHQSLDVLLTTPLESDEIVRQKFAGIWRMIHMLWIPFTTIYVFQIWWESWVNTAAQYPFDQPHANVLFTTLRAVLSVGLYLPTIAWFGFHLGLRCRSQTQAILVTMTMISLICVIPPLVAWLMQPGPSRYGFPDSVLVSAVKFISPAATLSAVPHTDYYWILLIFHFMGVSILYLWLANRGRKVFAKKVGRNDGDGDEQIDLPLTALSTEDRMSRLRRGQIGKRADNDMDSAEAH